MPKHIDQQRTKLLARADEIAARLRIIDGREYDTINDLNHEQEEIGQALAELDEVAHLGDDRPHPRLKVRKGRPALDPDDLDVPDDARWVVSIRHTADDDVEQLLGYLPDMRTAHGAAIEYVAVQRFLADRLAHPHGAGL